VISAHHIAGGCIYRARLVGTEVHVEIYDPEAGPEYSSPFRVLTWDGEKIVGNRVSDPTVLAIMEFFESEFRYASRVRLRPEEYSEPRGELFLVVGE